MEIGKKMATLDSLYDTLSSIVGDAGILPDDQVTGYTVDDILPKVVIVPADKSEMQDVLRIASERNVSVIPAGSGSKLSIGNVVPEIGIVMSTKRLNKVIEYEPADLTVTVESGIRLSDLQKELAVHRQYLPLNPPYADNCTIGGIVATNSSGPLRLQHGTARNLVLGLHVMLANGTVVKSGGKVVKNVAGYDLNKLYIGSYGTLGIITEVSLKLSPIPPHETIFSAQYDTIQKAIHDGLSIVSSQVLPSYVVLMTECAVNGLSEQDPTLFVGFGGEAGTVSWQLDSTQSQMEQNGAKSVHIIEGESQDRIGHEIQEYSAADKVCNRIIIRVNLKRTDLSKFAEAAHELTSDMMFHLGNGVAYLRLPVTNGDDFETTVGSISKLRQQVIGMKGNLTIESAPPELKQHLDIWGPVGNTLDLMKHIKTKFDSKRILNAGRFVT
ncbi:FAD-binding oxidoreductase [Candidatus Poribacteria bacterium]|nr:FAD-binding oxidoreductase [Candidatus Poribacteria bacterium]MYB64105.1 FAD-binding oxidoreductase [Candidatus Poribacteria bacterium]MYF56909.1 FAD-binding oxidoreductase [Candidatus Poribacteria bacterium]